MRIKCPSCFAEFDLLSALDSEAGRSLMAVLAKLDPTLSRPLVAYMSLFRSASRALSWDRALKLAQEVLVLDPDKARLSTALTKAVEILREKQAAGGWKPLGNHNYLKRVLEGVPLSPAGASEAIVPTIVHETKPTHKSRTAAALLSLEALKHG